jgi:predicted ribosomally synthesized peptide with SipW-like signal peptide
MGIRRTPCVRRENQKQALNHMQCMRSGTGNQHEGVHIINTTLLMRRIIFSLLVIAGSAAAIVTGATGAFFSDTESSVGNTFAAGTLDLKIDNDSYYNGNRCTDLDPNPDDDIHDFQWQGTASYPEPNTPCETSFPRSDLDDGFLFFNFTDLKPDDEGEDTISIFVQNDAWACMDLTLTSNDDRSTTEPEGLVDEAEDENDAWDGELAEALQFFWWADDGDNVYEDDEEAISNGVQSLLDLAPQGDSFSVALADANGNVWSEEGPLPANETMYIAKAWCMGELELTPLEQDGFDDVRAPNDEEGPGVICDGTLLGNETQTDAVELNVVFSAIQARHNPDFLCDRGGGTDPETATLTVNKIIVADTAGIGVEDFELHIVGPSGDIIVGDNIPETGLIPGTYTVSEVILPAGLPPGTTFTTTFGGACDPDTHQVTLADGDSLICTITNVENEPAPPPLDDDFGTGECLQDIPGWEEDPGESCVNGTVAAAIGTGDNTASPDGGRFALLGNAGYICRGIDATGLQDLELQYYWRGDSQADAGDTGSARYYTGGTCAAPTGQVTIGSPHDLTVTSWSSLQSIALPDVLDNTSFFIRFTADTNNGNESFRIDGIKVIGN